ncbi:hypothetical protein BAE44_0026408 [Dichanthelium oligosanthes]|uniref:Uncharacterized protein n=1 Tax=Dichanthelium oligosanthes TaxID=888268 RepID=A0A1E5UI68_9POAL|nr:hypothetical protein BAE44_0026408 [Dichanthelium oligosanthes]
MDVVATRGSDHRRRRKGSSGHVVAQLLESPLPTPRRSCCGRAAAAAADAPPAARWGSFADASPRRGHVPFKWESAPGVPKSAPGVGGGKEREVPPLLPKPPPGRCGGPCRARAYHHSNTTDSSSDHDDDTFSDALDRISSSDRLAALSARLSAIDGVFGSRRSPSFIMDRFLPAANAIATTSADKHPRRRSPLHRSRSKHAKDADAAARAKDVAHIRRRALAREQHKHPPRRCMDAVAARPQLPQRVDGDDAEGDQVTPRACGLLFFVPWSAKPVLLGFQRSPARSRTTRAEVASVAASSPPRRSITLGDVLEKERKLRDGGLSHWYDEKSGSGKEWSNPGWGMALLGTSKRYCADARKALSRLTHSGTDGGDSPRIGKERRSGKPAASMLRSTSVKMPPLSPPSESWLTNARKSNAGNNKR